MLKLRRLECGLVDLLRRCVWLVRVDLPWVSVRWLVSMSVTVSMSMGVPVGRLGWSLRLRFFGGLRPVRILIMVLSWSLFGWCSSVI